MSGLDITPRLGAGKQLITGYGNGGFKISGQRHDGPVLVFPNRTLAWAVTTLADVSMDSLAPVLAAAEPVQILILGCGRGFLPPDFDLQERLLAAGIALEWMDTGAACRTYNVLLLDGRDVAAALLAVD